MTSAYEKRKLKVFSLRAREIRKKRCEMNKQHSAESFYSPKIKSLAYGASLYKEVTTMNTMMVYQSLKEQRKYPRFTPDTKIFILHASLGTVRNIGIGGLSYTYYHLPTEPFSPLPKNGTIFSAENDYLVDIPFTVVTDRVVRKSYSCFPELKQRRIRFSALTGTQLQGLEQFILTHAVVPEVEVDNKTVS